LIILAVVFAVAVLRAAALAQDGPGICSEAFFQCVTVNCPANFNASCGGACRAQFNGCMRTGAFGGRDCRGKTLTRK
jgi:hypothetical protein